MNRVQLVIGAVLGMFDRPVHRTKLVKLVYLVDNRFYELNGQTLTGLGYMWDNYGPNAISNALVKEAAALVACGMAHMVARPSLYGTDEYLYWVPKKTAIHSANMLGPGEWQVIRDTVKAYGSMTLKGIVGASKKTRPFQAAKQYQVLSLRREPLVAEMQQELASDPDFMREARRGLEDLERGRLTSQEEMDRLYQRKRSRS